MADLREGENAPGTDIVIDSDEDEKENGDNGQKKPSAAQTLPVKAEAGGEKGGLERDDNDMDADDPESLEPLSNTHPSAPKRYMSAFFLYSEAKRESIKQANPSASPQEIAKLLSRDFKAMESEERAYWDGKAAEDKQRCKIVGIDVYRLLFLKSRSPVDEREMENYDPTLTSAASSSDTGIASGTSAARKVSMSPPTYSHQRPKKKKKRNKKDKVKTEKAQTEPASDTEKEAEGEDAEEADEITYEPYQPAKLKYGRPHPDPVVENATLAAVAPPGV